MWVSLRWVLIASLSLPLVVRAAEPSADAAELYHDYCSVCHGDHGDGRSRARQGLIPPPRDFTAPGMATELPRQRMVDSVLNGRPGTAMVGWKSRLSPEQAAAIVDYIRSSFMREGTAPAHASQAAPGPHAQARDTTAAARETLPRGNAGRGRLLYMANCSTCHGAEGKGNGPRAYFIYPRPRDFTSAAAREKLNEATLFHAVRDGVQGKEMPAWGKVLNNQQIADVSAFVSRTFLQPRAQ